MSILSKLETLYLMTEVGELAKEILSISFYPTEEKKSGDLQRKKYRFGDV